MSGEQAGLVQAAWRRGQGPDADAIVFGDGSLVVMEHRRLDGARPALWQPLLRADVWSPDGWLDLDTRNDTATYGDHLAIAGEASAHGSIGWLALVNGERLEWLLVGRWCNPFAEVILDGAHVIARNTLDQCWTLPRSAPQEATISRLAHDVPLPRA